MSRFLLFLFAFGLGSFPLFGDDLGRVGQLWKEYLTQTVKRGLPLLTNDPRIGVVPYWPSLQRAWSEAKTLEPGADVDLVEAWIDLQEGQSSRATEVLLRSWPRPLVSRFSPGQWGETLFLSWSPSANPRSWTEAWLGWEEKAYRPRALVAGLEAFESIDSSAVLPLLKQSLSLYPDDRRFLGLIARHPEAVVSPEGLLTRDLARTGGWSPLRLRSLVSRSPAAQDLLAKAGYAPTGLAALGVGNYGQWLGQTSSSPPADGLWAWDADRDGIFESSLVFESGNLVTWSRRQGDQSLWTLRFESGRPSRVVETREGSSWTLDFESYPFVKDLRYRWGEHTLVYRFAPLAVSVPLWPPERFSVPQERLPSVLATLWLPLNPRGLAQLASQIETWEGSLLTQSYFLSQGQVWLVTEDLNSDGKVDAWSYFRSGVLDRVYRDLEGSGRGDLREIYQKGELTQVQSKGSSLGRTEFVLFPRDSLQLWDSQGRGSPLDRLFVWQGDSLSALVFAGSSLPWNSMPSWEPRP